MTTRKDGLNVDPRTGLYGFVVDITAPGVRPRKQARRRGFKTVREAAAARTALLSELATASFVAPRRLTFAEYLTGVWLPGVESTLRQSTFESYTRNIRLHVAAHPVGQAQLQALTPPALNALYSDMLAGRSRRALSARSVAYIATIVHRALREAVAWGYLSRNPAADATPPVAKARDRRRITTWTGGELATFLERTADDRLAALWHLLADTGCRRGEALGLRWADVDLDGRRVEFVRTVVEVEGGWAFSTPKTAAGERQISLSATGAAALRAHRARQVQERLLVGAGWQEHDLVFCRPDGTPLHPKTVSSLFTDAVKRFGLPYLSVHGLRHTWATHALQAGENPRVVQHRLGHSNVAVTLGIYSHVTAELDADAAERVAALRTVARPS